MSNAENAFDFDVYVHACQDKKGTIEISYFIGTKEISCPDFFYATNLSHEALETLSQELSKKTGIAQDTLLMKLHSGTPNKPALFEMHSQVHPSYFTLLFPDINPQWRAMIKTRTPKNNPRKQYHYLVLETPKGTFYQNLETWSKNMPVNPLVSAHYKNGDLEIILARSV
ncbi:hypothetical protein COT72_05335 [archaeon CG10_big_fil_rev_8_21_14_0_10_43_11]|nr:MAG: hypothetical protein COT72_05335 [archaeon CG10_big_fil_rev_8_21_14_0_10_43_11]